MEFASLVASNVNDITELPSTGDCREHAKKMPDYPHGQSGSRKIRFDYKKT